MKAQSEWQEVESQNTGGKGKPQGGEGGSASAPEPSLGAKDRVVMLTPAKDRVSRTGIGPNRQHLTELI